MLAFLPKFGIFDRQYLIISTPTRVIKDYNVLYAPFTTCAFIKIIKQYTIEILKVMISKITSKRYVF